MPHNVKYRKRKIMKNTTISFLKRNGFNKMETNSYANELCNVVYEDGMLSVINNNGASNHCNNDSMFWLIGVLVHHHYIPKQYIE